MHANRIHQPANHGRQHVRRRSCSKHSLAHFLTADADRDAASTQPREKANGIPPCLQQQRAYSKFKRSLGSIMLYMRDAKQSTKAISIEHFEHLVYFEAHQT